jgi:LysR family cyn operon transcriptional activator
MDFKQLRNFVTIADCQSFTKAAATLNTSQPAMSVSIKNLEREIGADLLVRTRKEIELTELGDQFLIYARSALREMEKARALTNGLNNTRLRTIRFGINSILVHAVNKHVISQFIEEHSNIKLEIDVATVPQSVAVERVSSGQWDFGVVLGNIKRDSLKDMAVHHCTNLTSAPHAWKSHPLAGKRMVSMEDLSKYDWIVSTMLKESNVSTMISRAGFKRPAMIAQINSFDAIMSLLEVRNALTILPLEIVKLYHANRFVRLSTKELQFHTEVNLLWPQDKEVSTPAHHLIDKIKIFLEDIH